MKKVNETYLHEETGIRFDIEHSDDKNKKVRISNGIKMVSGRAENEHAFIFNRSKPETIIKIAKTLLEIGEFCQKL